MRFAALCVALVGMIASAQQQGAIPDGCKVDRDVVYGKGGAADLKCDLWQPKEKPKDLRAGLVFIHGGGWSGGDKWIPYNISPIVRHGYVVAAVNYRLSGDAKYPAAVEDCKCAVRWLRKNAKTYGVDPDRIGVWGGSAGGHLAMMVGYADIKELEGKGGCEGVSSRVKAVCSWYGPCLLGDHDTCRQFFGGTQSEKPEAYKQGSPINHVTKDGPPILLMHGEQDVVVDISQSVTMLDKCKEIGLDASLVRVKNAGHGFGPAGSGKMDPSMDDIQKAMAEFFDKQLAKKK